MAFSLGESNGTRGKRRFRGGIGSLSEINVVPLVDVVLVLLIIFMLTAHDMEFGLEVNVPQVKQVKDTAEDLPVVSITRSGQLYLNERQININQIAEQVRSRFKDAKGVYVRADSASMWDVIAQVISALDEAKIPIKVVTKPLDNSSRGR
jgi:biopolymer transport protein ExbD